MCVEKDAALAAKARKAMQKVGGTHHVIEDDLFEVDLSHATVVYLFLLPELNARLRPRLDAQLTPGSRVVSRQFEIAGWPCGERLRDASMHPSMGLLLKWTAPVAVAPAAAAGAVVDPTEHLLNCAAADEEESSQAKTELRRQRARK